MGNCRRIEVGHRHRRRTHRSLAVDFRVVPVDQFRLITTQPLPAHRETAEALRLGNARLLQKGQRPTARPKEDELRVDRPLCPVALVLNVNVPAQIRTAIQPVDSVINVDGHTVLPSQPTNSSSG